MINLHDLELLILLPWSCAWVLGNDVAHDALKITQFSHQDIVRSILQLISDISRFLQKIFGYFEGTAISISFIPAVTINN